LKDLLAEKGLRIVSSGAVDRTQSHRPLVNIYRTNSEEIGMKLLKEGYARSLIGMIGAELYGNCIR